MEMQPAPLSLSWVGNSCLCQKDAERELIALRGKTIMQTGESNVWILCILVRYSYEHSYEYIRIRTGIATLKYEDIIHYGMHHQL